MVFKIKSKLFPSVISLLLILTSCDFSTHEWYVYESHMNTNEEIYMMWPDSDSSECAIGVADTALQFNNIQLTFPSDQSILDSYRESYYDYTYVHRDSTKVKTDSTLK